MAKSQSPRVDRPKNFEVEQENQRTPAREGEPPRPAAEPPGAERSAKMNSGALVRGP